jgi:D-xylose transport system ATP-binding protein
MAVSTPRLPDRTVEPRLRLQGINKSFGAVRALRNVDFEVYMGEIVGLVGDNGAGKSTLIKIISGACTADSGDIYIDGKKVRIEKTQDSKRLGIETVYQDLSLCDNLDVVENLFLGREIRRGSLGILDEREMEYGAQEVLKQLDAHIPSLRIPVSALSGGQRQSVAIAKALLVDARIVLLDEPTCALGITQSRHVLNLIKHLRDKGVAVIIISHNLADIFEIVDRIVVLRLGKRVATYDVKLDTNAAHMAAVLFEPEPLKNGSKSLSREVIKSMLE